MAVVLGMNAKLYRNSATYASPTWVEIDSVKDVTLSLETGEADVTTRAAGGWRESIATLRDASLEFEMVYDSAGTHFAAVKDAFTGGTSIEFLILDGAESVTGSQGLRAEMSIMSFSRNEALEEALTVSVSAKPTKPAAGGAAPAWYTSS
jgi:TP901-1 family phage major tail protein